MIEHFSLEGYLPDDRQFGFRTPVFTDSSGYQKYLQIASEFEDAIVRFEEIKARPTDFIKMSSTSVSSLGSETAAVFLGVDGPRAGSRSQLKQYVEKTLDQFPTVSLRLEWAEIYGAPEDRIAARESALNAISSRNSRLSRSSFWKSLLIDGVWTAITEGRVSEESRDALLAERHSAMLSVNLENEALISDSSWARISPHIKFDRASFRARAMRDMPTSNELNNSPLSSMAEGYNDIDEKQVAEKVQEIRSQGRQEERIALIIREFLENPLLAEKVLEAYSDRAQLAHHGSRLLKRNIEAAKYQPEEFFPWLVTELYRNCISFNRGELLYSLTRHLGHQEELAREIRGHAQAGQSADVKRLRSRILRRLEEVSPKIFLPEPGQQQSLFDDL